MGLNYVDISVAPPIFTETTIIPGKQGIQGIQGISGVYVGENAPTEADGEYNVWIKTNGEEMDFTGNGIKAFTYRYGISNSQQQIPTDWQDTPPEMKDNTYGWTKIDIEMTNETVGNQTFYVVAKQGTPAGFDDSKCTATIPADDTWAEKPTVEVKPVGGNTDKGFQFAFKNLRGKSIKNIRALYAVHDHPKEAPEDSKFSPELPDVVGQDNYLWTKVEVTVDGPNGGTVYAFPLFPKPAIRAKRVIRGLLQVLVPFLQMLDHMLAQMLMAASQQLKLRQMAIILRKNYILILTICAELRLRHRLAKMGFWSGHVIIQNWNRINLHH